MLFQWSALFLWETGRRPKIVEYVHSRIIKALFSQKANLNKQMFKTWERLVFDMLLFVRTLSSSTTMVRAWVSNRYCCNGGKGTKSLCTPIQQFCSRLSVFALDKNEKKLPTIITWKETPHTAYKRKQDPTSSKTTEWKRP